MLKPNIDHADAEPSVLGRYSCYFNHHPLQFSPNRFVKLIIPKYSKVVSTSTTQSLVNW